MMGTKVPHSQSKAGRERLYALMSFSLVAWYRRRTAGTASTTTSSATALWTTRNSPRSWGHTHSLRATPYVLQFQRFESPFIFLWVESVFLPRRWLRAKLLAPSTPASP